MEHRAGIGCFLRPDSAAVASDDLLADVEPESHPRGVASRAIRRSVEESEDRVELRLLDSDPAVAHVDVHAVGILLDLYVDATSGGRVLDRVREQVVHHLLDMVAIRDDLAAVLAGL